MLKPKYKEIPGKSTEQNLRESGYHMLANKRFSTSKRRTTDEILPSRVWIIARKSDEGMKFLNINGIFDKNYRSAITFDSDHSARHTSERIKSYPDTQKMIIPAIIDDDGNVRIDYSDFASLRKSKRRKSSPKRKRG